jgi:glycosyltransferase involved in cell wall biosynthesis
MKASVVIPTFNRPRLLQRTLQSLTRQSLPKYEFEVVVVDHGSTKYISELCSDFTHRLNLSYLRLERDGWSISCPKNAGILAAKGEVVILLDSGIVVPSTFVGAHVDKLIKEDCCTVGFCLGASREDEDWLIGCELNNPDSCWEKLQRTPDIPDPRNKATIESVEEPWVLFWGGNAAARRESLAAVGLFDETLTGWGFDDIELGYRLHKYGLDFRVADGGWAIHLPHPRAPLDERLDSGYKNFRVGLQKHSTLEMELYWRSDALTYHQTLRKLENLLQNQLMPNYQSKSNFLTILQRYIHCDGDSTLLVGLSGDKHDHDYLLHLMEPAKGLSAARHRTNQEEDVLPLLGIEMPFADYAFTTVIVTDIWKSLASRPCPANERYLYYLLAETLRVGRNVIILNDTSFTPPVGAEDLVSLPLLNNLLDGMGLQGRDRIRIAHI